MSNTLLNQIKKFNNHMNTNYKFGMVIKNHSIVYRVGNMEDYLTMSPSDFLNYKTGICVDYAEYEAFAFKNKFHLKQVVSKAPENGEFAMYYIESDDSKGRFPIHVWIGINIDGKFYAFESVWYDYKGVIEFNTEGDMIDYYEREQKNWYARKNNQIRSSEIYRIPMSNVYGKTIDNYKSYVKDNGNRIGGDTVLLTQRAMLKDTGTIESFYKNQHNEMSMMMEIWFNDVKKPYTEYFVSKTGTYPYWYEPSSFEPAFEDYKGITISEEEFMELKNSTDGYKIIKMARHSDSEIEEGISITRDKHGNIIWKTKVDDRGILITRLMNWANSYSHVLKFKLNGDKITFMLKKEIPKKKSKIVESYITEASSVSSTKIPYKAEVKYCYHTLQGPVKKGIPNLIIHKNDKNFRARAELILFKGSQILLSKEDKPNQYGTLYKLPGGGIDNISESIESAAKRECEEEILIQPKNVKYTGIEYSDLYKKIPNWHKICFHPDGIYYDGFISFICTAEYDKKYTGYVKIMDRDAKQASKAKFYDYTDIKDMLMPVHRKIIEDYLKESKNTDPMNNEAAYEEIVNSFTDDEKKMWGVSSNKVSNKEKKARVFSKFLYDGYMPTAFACCTDSGKLGLAKGDVNLSFAVHSKYRRQGLATKVIKEAIKWFKESNYDTMTWIMDESNNASKHLAEKCGFVLMDHWKDKHQFFYMITNPSKLKAIGEETTHSIFKSFAVLNDPDVQGSMTMFINI